MRYSITQSCDVYYYTLGREIGIGAIAGMAKRLGLNTVYDELPVPTQRKGVMGDPEWKMRRYKKGWLAGETLNASIGQGYTATTPLQLAVMAARLASGRAVEPRLIVEGKAAIAPSLGISDDHLRIIHDGMFDVVNSGRGTAGNARIRSEVIRMSGKTGSAQVKRITMADRRAGRTSSDALPWRFRDHALFVAFAPAEAPRYAAAVVVEHGSHGSSAAAPIARDVLQLLFEPAAAQRTLAAFEEKWAADRARIAAAEAFAQRQADAAAAQAAAAPPSAGAAAAAPAAGPAAPAATPAAAPPAAAASGVSG
jgi:penicillin-binding protein 2